MKTSERLLGHWSDLRRFDDGFGMIEVTVSMFLLALLSVSFIPVLVNAWRGTGVNTTMVTATQIVNQELEGARAVRSVVSEAPSCYDLTQFLKVTLAPVTDPRGVTLQPQWDPTTCPTSYPGVVRVGVSVSRTGSPKPVASAVTLIFVSAANDGEDDG